MPKHNSHTLDKIGVIGVVKTICGNFLLLLLSPFVHGSLATYVFRRQPEKSAYAGL